jgi:hypothetical protein
MWVLIDPLSTDDKHGTSASLLGSSCRINTSLGRFPPLGVGLSKG